MAGALAYARGLSAERIVEDEYARNGRQVVQRRWRGTCGEIDLIARDGDTVIFIEVKASRSHARAAERVSRRQMQRICAAASEFLAGEPRGQLTDMRIDVATVDGTGGLRVIENAFGAA